MPPVAAQTPGTGDRWDVSVLVSSCDRFFDAWRPFAAFWRRHWPAHELAGPVYLVVNRFPIRSEWLTPIAVGRDRGWANNLRTALASIETEYLLYLQEDYFLTAPPDAARLRALSAAARAEQVDLLCLRAMPGGHGAEVWPTARGSTLANVREIPAGSPWRGRLQAALWRRTALLDALRPDESAWDFEAQAADRLRGLRAWTVEAGSTAADALPYLSSAIVRGLWTVEARRLCREQQIRIDPVFRGTSSDDLAACRRRRAWDRLRFPLVRRWELLTRGPMEL
jgi:hypothetical protein